MKTQPLPFPLPLISDLLDTLEGAKFYSSLDLCSGYWQMELDPRDRYKTAFCTEFGLFHWNRLPQGLKNAASSFQRLLEIVLSGLKDWNINTYLDDLIIASTTFEEHLERLEMVFKRLGEHNLKVNPAKCQLSKDKITYLGFQVVDGKILPDERNIESVKNFPIPKNKKQIRGYLGLCNFYRKFIKNFAAIALPLTNLTKNKVEFKWDEKADIAFNKLKEALISFPCLRLPNVKKDFILHTDASGYAIGAVLSQADESGDLHPVGYASRRLSDAETRYSVFERETLAVIWGINNFRQYLYGKRFVLYCDQKSLSYALKFKEGGRVARWALALQSYDFEIIHTPGKINVPADVLSRHVNMGKTENSDNHIHSFPPSRLKQLQANDEKCKELLEQLKHVPEITINKLTFFLKDGVLYCVTVNNKYDNVEKLVVPKTLISEVLTTAHDSITIAHPGFQRTLSRVRKNFFWWGMYKHIANYIQSCVSCCERRGYNPKNKAPLQRVEIANRPFEKIAMDAVGPLPITNSGNKHVIVISDYFTRWVEAYPVRDLKTETVAFILEKFICTHGIPEHLLTDKGSSFLAGCIKKVYDKLGIKKHSTTSYHPSSDGLVERANGTVINALKHLIKEKQHDWDNYIHFALLAYRTAIHSALKDTPAHLVYGRDLILPVDLIGSHARRSYADNWEYSEDLHLRLKSAFDLIKKNLINAAEKQEQYRERFVKDKGIIVGDLVMLYTPVVKPGEAKKFTIFNKGVYRVVEQTSEVNFKIIHVNNPKDNQLVHVDRLTKLPERIIFPSLPVEDLEVTQQSKGHTRDIENVNNNESECNFMPEYNYPMTYKLMIKNKNDTRVGNDRSQNLDSHNSVNSSNENENNLSELVNEETNDSEIVHNSDLRAEIENPSQDVSNSTLSNNENDNNLSELVNRETNNSEIVHDLNIGAEIEITNQNCSNDVQSTSSSHNDKINRYYSLRPRDKSGFVIRK